MYDLNNLDDLIEEISFRRSSSSGRDFDFLMAVEEAIEALRKSK